MADPLTKSPTRVVIVTDPMCSWCWGMANDIDMARKTHQSEVVFDIMLGGINTDGKQPIGEYGRRYLQRLWVEVHAVTGQTFGTLAPQTYVHNSTQPCLALEAVRLMTGEAPFDFLHKLQSSFFVNQLDITDRRTLLQLAVESGYDAIELDNLIASPQVRARVDFQFENAGGFGTGAMPSVLIEKADQLQLLAGGYVDANMLEELFTAALALKTAN